MLKTAKGYKCMVYIIKRPLLRQFRKFPKTTYFFLGYLSYHCVRSLLACLCVTFITYMLGMALCNPHGE